MGSRRKLRRKLTINERLYLWHVKEDDDSMQMLLHINSDDKKVILHYLIGQKESKSFIVIIGSEFGGVFGTGGMWRRFRCPCWVSDGAITPGIVRQIIEWSLNEDKEIIEVDCLGIPVPLGGNCVSCDKRLSGCITPDITSCPHCSQPIVERFQYHRNTYP